MQEQIAALNKTSPTSSLHNISSEDLDTLEATITKEKADQASVEAKFTKANETLKYHTERPQIIRQRLIEANQEADGIAGKLQQPVPSGERTIVTEARRWAVETQRT